MSKSEEKYDVIEIEVPLFGMQLEVFLSDISKLKDWAQKEFSVDIEEALEEGPNADGLTVDLGSFGADGYVVIALRDFIQRLKDKETIAVGVLVHECLHAVKVIFESRGIPFTPENEEVIAYLQEHLVESALEAVKRRMQS